MKRLLLGSVALVAVAAAGPAPAADMPVKAPPVALNWTGCYVGDNVGYGWANNRTVDDADPRGTRLDLGRNTGTGFVGGGQIGCDYQSGNWVFGARGMLDWANIKGSNPISSAAVATGNFSSSDTLGFKTQWFGTLTGRVGYAVQPQWLAYLNGGAAWVRNSYTDSDPTAFFGAPFTGTASATRTGWLIGGGLEYKVQRNWSLFAEYNYIQLGGRNVTLSYNSNVGIFNPYTFHFRQNLQTILLGLNYRFGG